MRRLTALMLLLLLLLPQARAGELEDRLSGIAMINQNSETYRRDKNYRYNDNYFPYRGCGPASIANALCLIFDVTEQEEADQLLLESMKLFTNGHQPAREIIDIKRIERLTGELKDYPVIRRQRDELGAVISYQEALLSLDITRAAMDEADDNAMLLLCRVSLTDQWDDVVSVCEWLRDVGHGDAWILAVYVSSGTLGTIAPFRGGESGHYISVAFEASALLDRCAFYVLDSNPRAVPGEEYGRGQFYAERYTMARKEGRLAYDYTLTHLRPEVVLSELKAERLEELASLGEKEAAALRLKLLGEMLVFGRSSCFVYVP